MNRRNFLKVSAAGAAGVAVAPELVSCSSPVKGKSSVPVQGYVKEPARQIPVVADVDVVVVGGGPAGVAAAVCAARKGASVALIERYNHLGGLWTGGMVFPVLATNGLGKDGSWSKSMAGFGMELCDRLDSMGMCIDRDCWGLYGNPTTEPEATKYVLDRVVEEAGIKMIYHSTAAGIIKSGDRIDSVLIECKSGRLAIKCKFVIDCSGDADVVNWAGDPCEERLYHIGLSHKIGNADRINRNAPGYVEQYEGWETPLKSVRYFCATKEAEQNGLDVFNLTRLQMKFRKQIWDQVEDMKRHPGYEEIFLMEVAPQLGVRVSRVLESFHNVTLDESMKWTAFDDVIGIGGACDPFQYDGKEVHPRNRPIWQIPYRAILPKKTKNLLVAGRCFGFDKGIAWDAREISTCFITGQAAGTAAAMAVNARCAAADVDIDKLQASLREQKVRLDY